MFTHSVLAQMSKFDDRICQNCLIQKHDLGYTAYYDRCAYEEDCGVEKAKHSYRLQMSIPVSPRKFCQCQSHLTLSQQNLKSLGKYPPSLTREIATEVGRYFGRKTVTFSR